MLSAGVRARAILNRLARTWDAMERRDDRLVSVAGKAKSALAATARGRADGDVPRALRDDAQRQNAASTGRYGIRGGW